MSLLCLHFICIYIYTLSPQLCFSGTTSDVWEQVLLTQRGYQRAFFRAECSSRIASKTTSIFPPLTRSSPRHGRCRSPQDGVRDDPHHRRVHVGGSRDPLQVRETAAANPSGSGAVSRCSSRTSASTPSPCPQRTSADRRSPSDGWCITSAKKS